MSIKVNIPFDDPAQHIFGPLARVSDGVGGLANLYPDEEMFYYNFEEDGILKSTRGNTDIEFFGDNNTGSIESGILKLGTNLDESSARVKNFTLATPHVLSARLDYINRIAAVGASKTILTITDAFSDSKIKVLITVVGGGVVRLNVEIYDVTGTLVHTIVDGIYSLTVGELRSIAFSFQRLGDFTLFVNGVHNTTVSGAAWNVSLTEVTAILGEEFGNSVTAFDFDNFQMINAEAFTGTDDIQTGELVSRSMDFVPITTASPLLMKLFIFFQALYRNYKSLDEFRHTLIVNSKDFWFNVVDDVWEEVRDQATNLNTLEEIADNLDKLQIYGGNGAFIQLVVWIRSLDGYSNPEITDYNFEYNHYFSLGDPLSRCIVVGAVLNESGEPVEGAIVYFTDSEKDYFYDDSFIGPTVQVTTGAAGKFDISLVETETVEKKMTAYVIYQDVSNTGKPKTVKRKYENLTIPNLPGQTFAQIVKDSLL